MPRKPYSTDVSDEEWSFAAPYLTLMDQHAPQREHDLREVFNALRWLVRAGAPWRMLPNALTEPLKQRLWEINLLYSRLSAPEKERYTAKLNAELNGVVKPH